MNVEFRSPPHSFLARAAATLCFMVWLDISLEILPSWRHRCVFQQVKSAITRESCRVLIVKRWCNRLSKRTTHRASKYGKHYISIVISWLTRQFKASMTHVSLPSASNPAPGPKLCSTNSWSLPRLIFSRVIISKYEIALLFFRSTRYSHFTRSPQSAVSLLEVSFIFFIPICLGRLSRIVCSSPLWERAC